LTIQSTAKRRQQAVAVLVLPGTVTIAVPAVILWLWGADVAPGTGILGAVVVALGVVLVAWTIRLFDTVGRGTLAPWEPTSALVVRGPYRYVRNPMITGVATILAGEALFFRSWGIAIEFAVFVAVNAVYFPLVEEPGLRRRFGRDYEEYCASVPRWLPRVRL
jgi:protein-S-isoprenylcysteine O-methyltransferase Ste14